MKSSSIFSRLVRAENGTFCTSYGPVFLQSALQPIFRRDSAGELRIDSFEGLVRASRDAEPWAPAQFFSMVAKEDLGFIDSMLRVIHILNTGRLNRPDVGVFVNFTPGLYRTDQDIKQEVDRIRLATREAGLQPNQIVCEISEKADSNRSLPRHLVERLHDSGFRIAIDDYGAGNSDIERVTELKPDFVKFEARWVRDFMANSAGAALLRVIVERFAETGIVTVFEGLEEMWQVELCAELGVPLMQGYALARPELAPTSFNERFPLSDDTAAYRPEASTPSPRPPAFAPRATTGGPRPSRTFGKRTAQ